MRTKDDESIYEEIMGHLTEANETLNYFICRNGRVSEDFRAEFINQLINCLHLINEAQTYIENYID